MNNDLHDMDDLFRSQLEDYQVKPSATLKRNLVATLDKKEAEKYKRRFIIWKRMALILLALLTGLVLFDAGLIKSGGRNNIAKNIGTGSEISSGNKTTIIDLDKDNNITDKNTIVNQAAVPDNNLLNRLSQDRIIVSPEISFIRTNGIISRKNNPMVSIFSSQPDKKGNEYVNNEIISQVNEPNTFSLNKTMDNEIVTDRLAKIYSMLPPASLSKLVIPLSSSNNSGKTKSKAFTASWLLSPFVSYDQAGYRLDSDDRPTVTDIKHREVNEPSFSLGLLIARQFSERFSLQSGLSYTSAQIGISPQKMYALQLPGGDIAYKFISSSGYAFIKLKTGQQPAVGDSITTSDAKHLLQHISVPLLVKYKIGKNKLTVSPFAGVEANLITSAKVEVGVDLASNLEIVTVNNLNGIKKLYWSANAGLEGSYQVNKKLSVNIQPVLRFALSPITKNNVVETFPRSFGIRAGVTFKL